MGKDGRLEILIDSCLKGHCRSSVQRPPFSILITIRFPIFSSSLPYPENPSHEKVSVQEIAIFPFVTHPTNAYYPIPMPISTDRPSPMGPQKPQATSILMLENAVGAMKIKDNCSRNKAFTGAIVRRSSVGRAGSAHFRLAQPKTPT